MEFQAVADDPSLAFRVRDGVATIMIDRPARKNALTQVMWERLATTTTGLADRDDVRVIVLRGTGSDFCAGADIAEFETVRGAPATARIYEAANAAAFAAFRTARVPTIAAIRGICFGGGFGLAAACDLRIATPDSLFAVPAARLGLAYPVDAMGDIVAALGSQRARHLLFTAARLSAADALEMGFLLEIVEDAHFSDRIDSLARSIAANAPLTIRASKLAIRAVVDGEPATAQAAARLGATTFESSDYAEGRAAFAARRAPVFRGR